MKRRRLNNEDEEGVNIEVRGDSETNEKGDTTTQNFWDSAASSVVLQSQSGGLQLLVVAHLTLTKLREAL